MDDILSTGNIIALVALAGVVLPLLKKHWYRFTQLLWATAMFMTDAKIIRWAWTSNYWLGGVRLVLGVVGVVCFTLAFVWAIWQVQRDMSEAVAEVKSLKPIFNKLTDLEKVALRQMVLIGQSTRTLNTAQPLLISIAEKTGFVRRTFIGHYELNRELRGSLRELLANDDRSLLVSLEPGVGLVINVKSEGRKARSFKNNEIAGEEPRPLEGFDISFDPKIDGLSLEYMGHFEVAGDVPYVSAGSFLSAGNNFQLEGFAIRLTGANKDRYEVLYSAHAPKFGNYDECSDGKFCGSRRRSRSLDTIIVRVLPRSHSDVGGRFALALEENRGTAKETA